MEASGCEHFNYTSVVRTCESRVMYVIFLLLLLLLLWVCLCDRCAQFNRLLHVQFNCLNCFNANRHVAISLHSNRFFTAFCIFADSNRTKSRSIVDRSLHQSHCMLRFSLTYRVTVRNTKSGSTSSCNRIRYLL